jgi:outer membrane protein assembly factor BamB
MVRAAEAFFGRGKRKHPMTPRAVKPFWVLLAITACIAPPARAATLEQVISREHPALRLAEARVAVGRDGRVYLCNGAVGSSFVLRLTPDGKAKLGKVVGSAARNATANAAGVVATANAHFAHAVTLLSTGLETIASADDFLVNDKVGWDAPAHVEAGASGDFYGLDQHRDRILRLSADGKVIRAYTIPHEPKGSDGIVQDFRVCEKAQAFYLLTRSGPLRCVGFDGATRWASRLGVAWAEPVNAGGFDADDDGRLYAVAANGAAVQRVTPSGERLAPLKLTGEADAAPYTDLRVWRGELFLKRRHDTELLRRHDLKTGALTQVVNSDHERLTVTYADGPWIAGGEVPFRVRLSGARGLGPRWRVRARTLSDVDYRELPLSADRLRVPDDFAGLYQLQVTPEVRPWQGGAESEYLLRALVEVRQPDTHGTVSVCTPDNRVFFGRGEEIPFWLRVRAKRTPATVTVRLSEGGRVLAEGKVKPDASASLPAALTAALRPGRYTLTATSPGLTSVAQPLVIGPGVTRSPFHLVQYGDYAPLYPTSDRAGAWTAPDLAAARVSQARRLGVNLVVDRLGEPGQIGNLSPGNSGRAALDSLARRLAADPLATAPEKAAPDTPLLDTLAGYSAYGIEQSAILMMNDAGLPLGGKGFDPRKPPQLTEALTRVTKALRPYPAFRGWSWSSNWWLYERGSAAARTPTEKEEYDAALSRARATGAWDPVLERVSDRRLGYAVEAQALFNKALRQAENAHLLTATAAPYRNVEAYPPLTFANVDEVDLHAQWEQIAPPYATPHGVDFYKRPGKRAFAHPEVWNDAGTGEQILPTLFQAVMRGADGVGFSGPVPPWGERPDDERLAYAGTASVYRALGGVLRQYGPCLTTLRNNDRVAIVCSGRMFRIDEWGPGVMGVHFARVMEAYCSCLHAHHPASLVFAEDLKPGTLAAFKAVLVVGQTVEMEPALAEGLKAAHRAGVAVLYDGTCRASVVKEFTPLGISFSQFEKDAHAASDDSAYWRFAEYCRANSRALAKALVKVTPPVAEVENPEVFVSERAAEEGRYLFVVNYTTPRLEPGQLWRVSLAVASRVPVVAKVRLAGKPRFVYDVFAGKQVEARDGVVEADCRSLPARVFAVLPAAIARVELRGPATVEAGARLAWSLSVQDTGGAAIRASVPLRLRLLGAGGEVLDERFTAAGAAGAKGDMTAPLNGHDGAVTLEATELFSGKSARVSIKVAGVSLPRSPLAAVQARSASEGLPRSRFGLGRNAAGATGEWQPADAAFGPHLRDVVLADNGSLAVLSAMNWDHNLYAVDTATGRLRWRRRAGHYFAFAPRPLARGFAVQGFDFRTAEGYHLHLFGSDGTPERRFALYGLPKRLPHRFVPGIVRDRINAFALPAGGKWVAAAGDLGLAVWKRDGKLLWSQDWWKTRRHTAALAALGADALLVVEGAHAAAYEAATGKRLWELELGQEGEVREARVSPDGKTCALASTAEGGRVYVLKDGKLAATLPTTANTLAVSPDGSHVAVASSHQLKLYSVADGLRWVLPADEVVRFPRFAPDGKRLVASSDLGTVYVVGLDGTPLLERDVGALAAPAWLPEGDLLLAAWMGTVCRLDSKYAERWRTHLRPAATNAGDEPLADDRTPTTRITGWGNAEAKPLPLTPNLLSPSTATIQLRAEQPHIQLVGNPAALVDGKPDPPKEPWIRWGDVGWFAETSRHNFLQIDSFRSRLRVTGITLVEDPAHPESWLRDATLEYWDAAKERWGFVQPLLSDAAVHTHKLARPVEASRFRIGLPEGLYGNLRLGEVVLHGERLGTAHPDVVARRPVAVLFDEGDDLKETLAPGHNGLSIRLGGAYHGDRCLSLRADATVYPPFLPPFGHALPGWDFEVVESPAPGQYRHLQFAWKAAKGATGVFLQVGSTAYGQQVAVYAGEHKPPPGVIAHKIAEAPPAEWRVVRVDLWKVFGRPVRVQMLGLGCRGGAAEFDQIVLGRTEKDLPGGGK